MIVLVERATGLSAADAYSLCSIAADMHVTQLVNLHKGIHVMLAKSALQKRSLQQTQLLAGPAAESGCIEQPGCV